MALEIRRNALLDPEIRRADNHALVLLRGELDSSTAGQLYEQLSELTRDGVVHVALDLSELEFMDSTGLSTLVKAHQRAEETGQEFGLVRGPQQVQRLLSLTGVEDRLTFADTPEELLAG